MSRSSPPTFGVGTFSAGGSPAYAGLVLHEHVLAIQPALCALENRELPAAASVRDLLADWETNFALLARLAERVESDGFLSEGWKDLCLPMEAVRPLPPLDPPGAVIAVGANYRQHVMELIAKQGAGDGPLTEEVRAEAEKQVDERARNGQPFAFVGLPSAVCGATDDVVLHDGGTQHDWELELAVVIGRAARKVDRHRALDYVAGYTICNDLTTRDRVFRKDTGPLGADWLAAKSARTFFPLGPYLVPAAFVPNPQDLEIKLSLNGKLMQSGHTSDMVFGVARLIEYFSSITELQPGDVITTGSPQGNGMHWGRFLGPGDVMEGEITGLGRQRNRCIKE